MGWFVYYDHNWSDQWTSSVGYSEHRQSNTGGQLGTAFKKGSYASANLLHSPVKNVTVGAELLWGQHEQASGATGDDTASSSPPGTPSRETLKKRPTVVPANAGTHVFQKENWAPAFAGATSSDLPR